MNLGVNPPLLRPIAGGVPFFLSTGTMLMGSNYRGVNHDILIIGIFYQYFQYPFPYATLTPAAQAFMHISVIAKSFW